MSYIPTQWKAGDTVTSAKLNKMEQGIAGGANILIAHGTQEVINNGSSSGKEAASTTMIVTLDKTAKEILDADFTIITITHSSQSFFETQWIPLQAMAFDTNDGFSFLVDESSPSFHAATEDDYPIMTLSGSETPTEGPTISDDSSNLPVT